MGLLGAVLTAFYMFRLYVLCFRGESRLSAEAEHHLHESPPSMVVPLVVLAALSTVGGWVGPPMREGGHAFERWLAPVFESGMHGIAGAVGSHPAGPLEASAAPAVHGVGRGVEWLLIALSVGAAAVGAWLAFRAYGRAAGEPLAEKAPKLHRVLLHKYWVDEVYDAAVVAPIHRASQRLWRFWDDKVVDGAVNGLAYLFEAFSAVLRLFQTGFVGTYALFIALGMAALLLHLLRR